MRFNRRSVTLTLGVLVGAALLAPALVTAQDGRLPNFGPARNVPHTIRLVDLAVAQAQLDYQIPRPVLPDGYKLSGAFFLTPTSKEIYPEAEPELAAGLQWQSRMRPVGLIYDGSHGPVALLRASITVGRAEVIRRSAVPKGLALAEGLLRHVDGFQYAIRRDVKVDFLSTSFPPTGVTALTWRFVPPTTPEFVILDALWTLLGTMPEPELVRIASSIK
jgi:hypothetical protein